jgi:hypothetical protein
MALCKYYTDEIGICVSFAPTSGKYRQCRHSLFKALLVSESLDYIEIMYLVRSRACAYCLFFLFAFSS